MTVPEAAAPSNFIKDIISEDMKTGKYGGRASNAEQVGEGGLWIDVILHYVSLSSLLCRASGMIHRLACSGCRLARRPTAGAPTSRPDPPARAAAHQRLRRSARKRRMHIVYPICRLYSVSVLKSLRKALRMDEKRSYLWRNFTANSSSFRWQS